MSTSPCEFGPQMSITPQKIGLNNASFVEYVPRNVIRALLISDKLKTKWDSGNYTDQFRASLYSNEKQQLERYLSKFNKDTETVKTTYTRGHQKYGRVYVKDSLGFTGFGKLVRNTMLRHNYVDLDLSNAQIVILREIALKNNIDCDSIEHYCNHRQEVWDEVAAFYNVKPKCAKKLFLLLAFGGTVKRWSRENNVDEALWNKDSPFVKQFKYDLHNVIEVTKKKNPAMYKAVTEECKAKWDNRRKWELKEKQKNAQFEMTTDQAYDAGKQNLPGKFFSKYLQEHETRIIDHIANWLTTNGLVIDPDTNEKHLVYQFDGLQLRTRFVERYGGISKLLTDLNDQMVAITGFNIEIEEKAIEDFIDIVNELKIVEQTPENAPTDQDDPFDAVEYKAYKAEFERHHCKIVSTGTYYDVSDPDEVIVRNRFQLLESFRHLIYGKKQGKPLYFIEMWVRDPSIRVYDSANIMPPPLICPDNTFNLWTPFQWDIAARNKLYQTNEDIHYERDEEALAFVLRYLDWLGNYKTDMVGYIKMYIAQLIQYPGVKHEKIFQAIGQEGVGKSSFFQLLEALIGKTKTMTTGAPETDVWGPFNSQIAGKLLICIEELDKAEGRKALNKLKNLTQATRIPINKKGHSIIEVDSYHRFFMPTNCIEGAVPLGGDNRRFVTLECSPEFKGKHEFWTHFYDILKNANAMRTIFDHFNNASLYPEASMFQKMPIPDTDYNKILVESNRSYYDMFLEQYAVEQNERRKQSIEEESPVERAKRIRDCTYHMVRSSALFEQFNGYLAENKIAPQNTINNVRFGLFMATTAKTINHKMGLQTDKQMCAGQRSNGGKTWLMHIPSILQYYGYAQTN